MDGRLFHRVDTAALRAAKEFEVLDVAPVAPFGACAALSGIDQNNVLTDLRRAEVLADPTIALAVAERRRDPAARHRVVRLCTRARHARMQSLEGAPEAFMTEAIATCAYVPDGIGRHRAARFARRRGAADTHVFTTTPDPWRGSSSACPSALVDGSRDYRPPDEEVDEVDELNYDVDQINRGGHGSARRSN